jgi:hypothetical protein
MDTLTNAVQPRATDRATLDHKNVWRIACQIPTCLLPATWTFFYADGGANRYCRHHGNNRYETGAYATANHAPIKAPLSVDMKDELRVDMEASTI